MMIKDSNPVKRPDPPFSEDSLPRYGGNINDGRSSLSSVVKSLSDILTSLIEATQTQKLKSVKREQTRAVQIGIQELLYYRNINGSFSEPFADAMHNIGWVVA